jgi:predicted transglutaminase-like cysteine proteinase
MSNLLPLSSAQMTSLSIAGYKLRPCKLPLWSSVLAISAVFFASQAQAGVLQAELRSDSGEFCRNLEKAVPGKSNAILGLQMSALEAMQNAQKKVERSSCPDGGAVPNGSAQISSVFVNHEPVTKEPVNLSKTQLVEFPASITKLALATQPILPQPEPQMVVPMFVGAVVQSSAGTAPIMNQELVRQALVNLGKKQWLAGSPLVTNIAFSSQPILSQLEPQMIAPVFASRGILSRPETTPLTARNIEQSVKTHYNGKPDIFGSLALKISRTPMDQKWKHARNVQEINIARTALAQAGGIVGVIHKDNNIRAVNRWVNANVRYVDDYKLYGKADYWASVGRTLKSGRGDCEDYAIAKMELLKASGILSSDMFLVIAKDLVRRADHALLVVRVGNDMLVLDNETDRILHAEDVRDYRPIMSFSSNGKWLHGYPAKPTNIQMASLELGR